MEMQSMLAHLHQHLCRHKKAFYWRRRLFFTSPSKTPLLGGLSAFQIGSF
jgi:hypothetical protein